MSNRIERTKTAESNKSRDNKATALTYFTPSTSVFQTRTNFEDLVVTLASAHENKRARQVVEWESLRRRTLSV